MLAIMRDASNHELCLRPWAMPTTMHYSSNNLWCQQPRAMSIATPMVATASNVRTTGDASNHGRSSNYTRDSQQQYMIAAMMCGASNNERCEQRRVVSATMRDASDNAQCQQQRLMLTTMRDRSDNEGCQQRTMVATTTIASNR